MKNMKKKLLALAALLCLAAPASVLEAAPIPLRGIVEGFYGTPWSQGNRLDMLSFLHQEGMNAYIYAPKDDPYHRDKWREPYPKARMQELGALIAEARRQQVKFIFALSPGLDLHFSGFAGIRDRVIMKKKLEAMYDLGVRDFAIFFDDIKQKDGKGQAELLNWLENNFRKQHPDITPLITVPTEYHFEDMEDKSGIKTYTREFSTTLNKDILVLYTGNRVVPDGLTDEDYEKANKLYGRKLGLWWNYPVSDYMEAKLALGPVEKLPVREILPAIFFNPMKHEELSKISLATGAEYAQNPGGYNAEEAWRKALRETCGSLAGDMEKFAEHSQHMENSWAKIGPADGTRLKELADAYWQERKQGKAPSGQELDRELKSLIASLDRLLASLPRNLLAESRTQIEQLRRIAIADRLGLELLAGRGNRKDFEAALKEVKAHDKKAIVSEESARKLLTDIEKGVSAE